MSLCLVRPAVPTSRSLRLSLLLLPLLFAAPAGAQTLQDADAHFQAERWDEAARVYEAVLAADSTVSMAWYRLGRVRYAQERHDEALELFAAAERHGFQPIFIRFGRARALAALGRADAAMDELATAADNGFGQPGAVTQDPGLAALADHSRMPDVLAAMEANSEPCRHSESARQLDFWIGSWDVYNPSGQLIGENIVEPMLKDCALLENWTGAGGSSGKSLNFYDPQRETWRQVWVSDQGNILDYRQGELRDGSMHFRGITLDARGDTTLQKLIFTPVSADTVRQVFETSTDGGTSWTTGFVGIYVRRR
jgi:tetratricopeptide (TPR) repeat protein